MPALTTGELACRAPHPHVAVVDLLDRVLAGGVVIAGDITLSIADVELVRISLRALVTSIRADLEGRGRCLSEVVT
ncbi:MAG TPA: gas vesicle protein [Streptosporangiaceae bacterium]|nr:gas vesicle protein [Streptosporangiaceae bacterium]